MNITENLLEYMGFTNEGVIDENRKHYSLYLDGVGFISLTDEGYGVYYTYFHKNKDDEKFNMSGRIMNLQELTYEIAKITKFESIKLGKELSQKEIKNALGL